MQYKSTRGDVLLMNSAKAIVKGLASDGGLFVPATMPHVTMDFIESLIPLCYEERACKVLELFLTDYTAAELSDCVSKAYDRENFDAAKRAPLARFGDMSVLELWHGPTSAFKDMALQLLPQLMVTALKKLGEKATILILVATSGDTGKAALEGFCDVEQTKIMVFYPENGVSKIQQAQMLTQEGKNVDVTAIRGNFDDAQRGVKAIFSDTTLGAELAQRDVKLSSANSINWGRLVPQIVYYFSAYADLLDEGCITHGECIDFTVPTGNFGDILAGYYAKEMGLPIHKLICASNSNNVLTDFLRTGVYDCKRDFVKTISPSMDILISSNLERLLYHVTNDAEKVASWMEKLQKAGRYDIGATLLKTIQETFWADWANDIETEKMIEKAYEEQHYVPDTHTAVAWKVANAYRAATGDTHHMVIVSTASPYKFSKSVLDALHVDVSGLDVFAMLEKLEQINPVATPKGLASLQSKPVLHHAACDYERMGDGVLSFASGKDS